MYIPPTFMSAPLMPADRWGERLIRRLGCGAPSRSWSARRSAAASSHTGGVARLVDDVPLFLLAWVVGRR